MKIGLPLPDRYAAVASLSAADDAPVLQYPEIAPARQELNDIFGASGAARRENNLARWPRGSRRGRAPHLRGVRQADFLLTPTKPLWPVWEKAPDRLHTEEGLAHTGISETGRSKRCLLAAAFAP
jgi:hypothetical protein